MKRWISMLLAVCLLAVMLLPASAAADTDSESARVLAQLGLFRGTGTGFALEEKVTRAQAVTMLVRFLGAEEEALADDTPSGFSDCESHWAEPYIAYARAHGITEGTSAGTFSPEDSVTGQQLAKLILSALGYEGVTLSSAASRGETAELLTHNGLKAAARGTTPLTRRTLADFFHAALLAKNADGVRVYRTLIERGVFTKEEFADATMIVCPDEEEDFDTQLFNQLKTDTGNVTISPLSVKLALAMAANGAVGETRAQMLRALGISDLDAFNEAAQALTDGTQDGVLSVANAFVINTDAAKEVSVCADFWETIGTSYSAEVLSKPAREIVKTVNSWVAEKTNNRIKNLISSSDFLACLVNAVWFKADWSIPFNTSATKDGSFANADGTKSTVPLMHMTKYLDYYEDEDCQVVRLPYVGGEYSMLVALGEYAGSLADYSDRLSERRVALTLPKFEAEYSVSLKDALEEQGMVKCFTADAEFDGMFEGESVGISDVLHKTWIRVTESGTEAAAATAVLVATTALLVEEDPVEFTADRPFTWCIVHNDSGEVLFCGTVNTLAG